MTHTSDTLKISSVKFNGYKIDLSENMKGKPTASLYKLVTVGKNKNTYQLWEAYYFNTEERRAEWVAKKMEDVKQRVAEKEARVNAKKEARVNMVNPFKVGEIYYDSWGYDQTNIDFYQVVEVKAKSVVMREIGGEMVEGTAGHDSCNVRPVADSFSGEPIVKPICVSVYDGRVRYYIKSRHGSISLYDYGEKGVHSSWGH